LAVLTAVVQAQAQAAQTTIEFIQKIGFEVDASAPEGITSFGKTRSASFTYEKLAASGGREEVQINVPLLSIVPIPYIRVEYTEIDFSAKINETITENSSDKMDLGLEASGGWAPVKFKASFSYSRSTSKSSNIDKEYQVNVKVRAVQDDMPQGLQKLLQMMEKAIFEENLGPVTAAPTTPTTP
jgi:hypothetical protein